MDKSKTTTDWSRVIAAYREHGKMLEKLGFPDKARPSYNKADELIRTKDRSAPDVPNFVATPTSTRSSNCTPSRNKKSVMPTIFTKDCPPPVIRYAFPGPDERLVNTQQLAFCLTLLQTTPLSLDTLDPEARAWLKVTEENQDEKDRLKSLVPDLIRALAQDELKDTMAITEIVCLAPVMEESDLRILVSLFTNYIKDSLLLNVQTLEGLAHLIQNTTPGNIDADDLIRILKLLSTCLQETFLQSSQHIYKLTVSVSRVLDAMADSNIEGLDRVKLHEPLLSYLDRLKADRDPYIVFQAAYASQALLCVPDDEEPWQAALRRSGAVIRGVGELASAVKGLNLAELINGLSTIQEGFQGAGQILGLLQDAYNGVAALKESGQGLLESLKNRLSFSHKRAWYAALRGADFLIKNGELMKLKALIRESPCSRDLEFQWGICTRLGCLAADPVWDDGSRKDAIAFLGEIYWNDEEWGKEPRIKQCIIDILLQLSQVSGRGAKVAINTAAEELLKDLATDNDKEKQDLYLACIQSGPSPHSWKVDMPLLGSSSLIDKVQKKPSVELALRKYRRRRLEEQKQGHTFFIPPQAKATRESSDDDLFDLTSRVNDFIAGDGVAKVLLLLGDSGARKSTFNLELEKNLWAAYDSDKKWIPIFVTLPDIDKPERDLIAKHLRNYDFQKDQICELKSYYQFVLICDGYDECQKKNNLYNDNRFNRLGEWNIKMVISCRNEFLGSDYRAFFQPGGRNDRRGAMQLQEAVVAPFSVTKISDYIRSYVSKCQSAGDMDWKVDDYKNAIKSIPNLQDLVRNPFLLSLALEVLPSHFANLTKDFTSSQISRVTLYDQFLEQWIERGKVRLIERSLTADDQAAFEILLEDGFTRNAIKFMKDPAVAIFDEQDGRPVVVYSPMRDKASNWKTAFFGHGDCRNLLREICPIRRTGDHQYRFIHRSVLEYGLARAIYEPHTSVIDLEDSVEQLSVQQETVPSDSPLCRKSFVHESSIINFLSERVQQSVEFENQLHKFIYRSKTEDRFSQAAANAITILVRAGVQFNGADLRGIRIPGADLSCGSFDSAWLQGSNLRNTILQNVWLRQADLSGSLMEGVEFGQWPYLQKEDLVVQCVFSPDEKTLAVVLDNGSISFYDTLNWSRTEFQGQSGTIETPDAATSVAYTPCSQKIVLGGEYGTVQLWGIRTGALFSILSGNDDRINSVACSLDGQKIAFGSSDKTVRLWDSQTGTLSRTLSGHGGEVTSVAFSPNDQQIASGSEDTTVRLWDARTGDLSSVLSGHTGYVKSVAYSPDGQHIVSCSYDHTLRLWNVRTAALSHVLNGHTSHVNSVAFSPDGHRIASSSWDKTVRLWDAHTGSPISILTGHTTMVVSVAYSRSGQQIASGSYDRTVRLWHSQTGTQGFTQSRHTNSALYSTLSGHIKSVYSVTCSPSGRQIASGSVDRTVRLWDSQTGALSNTLRGHTNWVHSVVYSPNGQQIASGSRDNTVRLWDAETGVPGFILSDHNSAVHSVVYSPNGHQIASGSQDTTVRLWNSQTGALSNTLRGHTNWVHSVVYSPNGQQIASGSRDNTVRLWDAETGTPSATLTGHTGPVYSVAYSPSGCQIASGSAYRTVRFWDSQNGVLTSTWSGHKGTIASIAYSPSGQYIAGCVGETVRLWALDSGECLAALSGLRDLANAISWLDDAYFVVACNDKSVSTWRVAKDESETRVCLRWRSGPNQLVLSSASIQGVQGLSETDAKLFQQQKAADQLVSGAVCL